MALATGATPLRCVIQAFPRRKHTQIANRKIINQTSVDVASFPVSLPGGPSSAEPCAHEGRAQQIAPASGQDAMCCVIQRNVKLTGDPEAPDTVQCSHSNWTRPSMTKRSPWSSRIEEGSSPSARRRTWNSTALPELTLTVSFGDFCGSNNARGCMILNRRTDLFSLLCTPWRQMGCDPAPQTNHSIPDGVIGLWSDCCSLTTLV